MASVSRKSEVSVLQELPKQLLAWLSRLLPKQEVTGESNVQVGKVGGNFTVVNHHHAPAPQAGLTTPAQRELLTLIRRLPNAEAVFTFMHREFGSRMVMDLSPSQVLRVRRYVEVVQKKFDSKRGKLRDPR